MTASPIDGIYGGEQSGAAGPALATDHTTIKGTLPTSFAVRLRFSRDVDALRVHKNDQPTAYIPQRIRGDEWLLWFEDGLAGNDTITIEPY